MERNTFVAELRGGFELSIQVTKIKSSVQCEGKVGRGQVTPFGSSIYRGFHGQPRQLAVVGNSEKAQWSLLIFFPLYSQEASSDPR